jgi:hypothetical protein
VRRNYVFLVLLVAVGAHAAIVPGDVIIDEFYGHLLKLSDAGSIDPLINVGASSNHCTGATVTPDSIVRTSGGLLTTQVDLYDRSTGTVSSFSTPNIWFTRDVDIFADGSFAITDSGRSGDASHPAKVDIYNSSHQYSSTILLPAGSGPGGTAIGPDNTLWITDTNKGRLLHYQEDGTALPAVTLPTWTPLPEELVFDSDQTIWVEDHFSRISHIQQDGTSLSVPGRFKNGSPSATGFTFNSTRGIALDFSGNVLICDVYDQNGNIFYQSYLDRYTRSGTLIQRVALPVVVDNFGDYEHPASGGVAFVVPEPGTFSIVALALLLGASSRRRTRSVSSSRSTT